MRRPNRPPWQGEQTRFAGRGGKAPSDRAEPNLPYLWRYLPYSRRNDYLNASNNLRKIRC